MADGLRRMGQYLTNDYSLTVSGVISSNVYGGVVTDITFNGSEYNVYNTDGGAVVHSYSVGPNAFTGPPKLATAGPGIAKALTDELAKLKIQVGKDAAESIRS